MMLEVIDRGGGAATRKKPIMFVHGGWHSAWCWEVNFLDFFAARGFRAIGLSLRGHGGSGSDKPLRECSIGDYLDDLRNAVDDLSESPVLIGHSMGGFIVQRFIENHHVPAAVLMALIPPQGVARAVLRLFRRHPAVALRAFTIGSSVDFVNTPLLAREALFTWRTPESTVASCVIRLQPESVRAVILGMIRPRVSRSRRVTTPFLVLGAQDDGMVNRREVRATARVYGTLAEFFPAMGHDMMLEPGWLNVAVRIDDWLRAQNI